VIALLGKPPSLLVDDERASVRPLLPGHLALPKPLRTKRITRKSQTGL
jgi:hypothetical protein